MSTAYPELLMELRDTVTRTLKAVGIEDAEAADIGNVILDELRQRFGGEVLYIPKGSRYELSKRDQDIWAAFDGHNHRELCRQYGLSIQRVYKILNAARADWASRNQGDVFSGE